MHSHTLWAPLLLIGALTVTLSACGGDNGGESATPGGTATAPSGGGSASSPTTDTGAPTGGETINACDLLTQEEVAAVLGSQPREGERSDSPPFYFCTFETEGFEQLDLSVVVFPSADDARVLYEEALDTNDYPEIEGLGDRAYDSRPIGDVTAQKGKFEVGVDILTEDDEADFQAAIELAGKALDRLP